METCSGRRQADGRRESAEQVGMKIPWEQPGAEGCSHERGSTRPCRWREPGQQPPAAGPGQGEAAVDGMGPTYRQVGSSLSRQGGFLASNTVLMGLGQLSCRLGTAQKRRQAPLALQPISCWSSWAHITGRRREELTQPALG